ncbi:hypothetical protein THAOC_32355 [Thalassiosira oceanica]|uniref:Uncharacterized protein n=1 Tax=Thalassiosira oceanica TaxID=159749 RepID=K0RQ45_THAOC|nr:hypothetical protein THAOC_32355 [Thalassiosira oceanica]|eukprot:EJK48817.1 hypothetical protein THAOC_32355 [Thalassiosira oceanica]
MANMNMKMRRLRMPRDQQRALFPCNSERTQGAVARGLNNKPASQPRNQKKRSHLKERCLLMRTHPVFPNPPKPARTGHHARARATSSLEGVLPAIRVVGEFASSLDERQAHRQSTAIDWTDDGGKSSP